MCIISHLCPYIVRICMYVNCTHILDSRYSVLWEHRRGTFGTFASFGNIGEYHEGREDWKQYAERLEHFLAANGITNADRKMSVFLSVIGPKAYKLLASLVAPLNPGEMSYVTLLRR